MTTNHMPAPGSTVEGLRAAGARGTILDHGTVTALTSSAAGTEYVAVAFTDGSEQRYSANTRGEYWRVAGEAWR